MANLLIESDPVEAKKHLIDFWYAQPSNKVIFKLGSYATATDFGLGVTQGTTYMNASGALQAGPSVTGNAGLYLFNNHFNSILNTLECSVSFWVYFEDIIGKSPVYPFCTNTNTRVNNVDQALQLHKVFGLELGFGSIYVFTENYSCGSNVSNYLYEGKWNHILIQLKATSNNTDSAMNLYTNGKLVSTLYGANQSLNTNVTQFIDDFTVVGSSISQLFQVSNTNNQSGKFMLADFAVYDTLLLPLTETTFDVPVLAPFDCTGISVDTLTVGTGSTNAYGVNQTLPPLAAPEDRDPATTLVTLGQHDNTIIKGAAYYFNATMVVAPLRYRLDLPGKIMFLSYNDKKFIVDIPFPYKRFTDMEFFCTKLDGTFIPAIYYQRINDTQIKFVTNPLNISSAEDVRFTFCHKNGFFHIQKYEQTNQLKVGQRIVQFESPYDNIVDLNKRVRVFLDQKFIAPNSGVYHFDNETGEVSLSFEDTGDGKHEISFLCFYTGTKKNDLTVPKLPMSGYIEFLKRYTDRVYDKDLFAVFMNGKLVSRDDIKDMSSRIHKIKRDIQTRYNLEVLNMSPTIPYLVPFLKYNKRKQKTDPTDYIWEFPCKMEVYYPEKRYDRYWLYPHHTTLNPVEYHDLVPDNLDWYITLMHHGVLENPHGDRVSYQIKFFRDNCMDDPEQVRVIGMVRPRGNDEEFLPDPDYVKNNALLLGTLPLYINNIAYDAPYFSVQAKTIYDADTGMNHLKPNAVDGIMCRMQLIDTRKDYYNHLYYEMDTTFFEKNAIVGVFEWVISDKPNGQGRVYYRKTIDFVPTNHREVGKDIYDDQYDEETTYDKDEQYHYYDAIYDNGVGDSGYILEENPIWIDPNKSYENTTTKNNFINRIQGSTSYNVGIPSDGILLQQPEEPPDETEKEKITVDYYIHGIIEDVNLKDLDNDGYDDFEDGEEPPSQEEETPQEEEFPIIFIGPIKGNVVIEDGIHISNSTLNPPPYVPPVWSYIGNIKGLVELEDPNAVPPSITILPSTSFNIGYVGNILGFVVLYGTPPVSPPVITPPTSSSTPWGYVGHIRCLVTLE